MSRDLHVVIAGAGPVGVVAALAAAQHGFRVTLLEAADRIDDNPRAATTHPSTLEYIDQLGLMEEFAAQGLVARYFQFWDRDTRTRVAQFDHDLLRDETKFPFVVQTEQHKLVAMGIRRLAQYPDATFELGAKVTGLNQDADGVTVTVERNGAAEERRANYLIGADGGRSTIRKLLKIDFEGYTWPERFVVLTTLHDFEKSMDCCYRNYLAGSQQWANLFKVAGDDLKGRWRAVFPAQEGESDEQVLGDDAVTARLTSVDSACRVDSVVHRNIYNVHQRVAAKFRVDRVFLAGDSSHLNNPIGGLGLNCGIHDAMELVATLTAARDGAPESRLDLYERKRRTVNVEFIQEQTISNKNRLEEKDPAVRLKRFDELRAIEADPVRQKEFLLRSALIASVRRARTIE